MRSDSVLATSAPSRAGYPALHEILPQRRERNPEQPAQPDAVRRTHMRSRTRPLLLPASPCADTRGRAYSALARTSSPWLATSRIAPPQLENRAPCTVSTKCQRPPRAKSDPDRAPRERYAPPHHDARAPKAMPHISGAPARSLDSTRWRAGKQPPLPPNPTPPASEHRRTKDAHQPAA